jgi:hypothetical protein
MNSKICTICKRELPIKNFDMIKRGNKRIPASWCIECRRSYIKKKCKEYRKDPVYHERELKRKKLSYIANHAARRAAWKVYYQKNKERLIEKTKRWYKTAPGRKSAAIHSHRRRERKRGVGTLWTKEHYEFIVARYGLRCYKCGSLERIGMDHLYPLSSGYPLNRLNAVPLCVSCNASKGNGDPIEFFGEELVKNRFFINEFKIEAVDRQKSIEMIECFHYLHSYPMNVLYYYGLYLYSDLVGVCVFSKPSRQNIKADLELSRFYIFDGTPKNTESYFLGGCLRKLKENGFVGKVISFADSTEGHEGTIYKATNWKHDGLTDKNYHYERGGERFHKRGIWERARRGGIKESEQSTLEGLSKVVEEPKHRFYYIIN